MFNVTGFTNALLNIHSLDEMRDSMLDRVLFLLLLALLLPIYRLNKVWFFSQSSGYGAVDPLEVADC